MIHIGESTGILMADRLPGHPEMERETRKRIKSALRYPIMVIGAIAIAMVVTMFVIPSFSSVFNKFLGADPPFATLILIVARFHAELVACLVGRSDCWRSCFRQFIATDEGAVW